MPPKLLCIPDFPGQFCRPAGQPEGTSTLPSINTAQAMPQVTFPSCLNPTYASFKVHSSLPSSSILSRAAHIHQHLVECGHHSQASPPTQEAWRFLSGQTSPYKLGAMALHSFTCLDALTTALPFHSWSTFIVGVAGYVCFSSNKYVFDVYWQLFPKKKLCTSLHW